MSYFLESNFWFIFRRVKFNLPLGLMVEILNVIFKVMRGNREVSSARFQISYTFGWNYMELFVMMISLGLWTRFSQINNRLGEIKGKVVREL